MRSRPAIVFALALTACPLSEANHPTRDDTAQPADDGSGDGGSCSEELAAEKARSEKLEADLAECRASLPQ